MEISSPPDTFTIRQDEESEIRVQLAIEGGERHVDLRLWRQSPTGPAPTRDALFLDRPDLVATRQAIANLLVASDGGTQATRIVLDIDEGRRIRAETKPFGTRYTAHFGFWQRSRTSWHPDGDGIDIAADRLLSLQDVLGNLLPRLETPDDQFSATTEMPRVEYQWPNPGPDWLTLEGRRVAFHPRGVRVTCAIEQDDAGHYLSVRQWRREEVIWLPGRHSVILRIADLHAVLSALRSLALGDPAADVLLTDGSTLYLAIGDGNLSIGQDGQQRMTIPASELPRLGRAFAQSWSLLAAALSPQERTQLEEVDKQTAEAVKPVPAETPPEPEPEVHPIARPIRFGSRLAQHSAVIPYEGHVRVMTGHAHPIDIPIDMLARVISGLEELYALQLSQSRIRPMLLCDRPDCAIYGRVGTSTRPSAVEVRVWESPRDSRAILVDRADLASLIDALRGSLRLYRRDEPSPTPEFVIARNMQAEPEPEVVDEPEPEPDVPRLHLTDITLGRQPVRLEVAGEEDERQLNLCWEGFVVALPVDGLDRLLADVRALYFDAMRGLRGNSLTAGTTHIAFRNQGHQLYIDLRGDEAHLAFPATELPVFLNATESALNRI